MKVSTSEKSKKVEKNIYVEVRSGSYRFTVAVYPLEKDTITVSPDEYAAALRWAQKRRLELLAVKAASKAGLCLPGTNNPPQFIPSPLPAPYPVAHSPFALDSQFGPGTIQMQDIFDGYRENELDKLAGKDPQTSRLNQLEGWFGHLTLSQLDYNYVDKWRRQRLAGKLGSGRNPNRGRVPVAQIQTQAERESGEISTDEQQEDEAPKKLLTKHQRYSRKKQAIKDGEKIPEALVFPVSTQSVRHELVLLRKAIHIYFHSKGMLLAYGGWLDAHHLFTMTLPVKSEGRDRRLSDEEITAIVAQIESKQMKSAILFSLLTSLRRGELISLKWEDVDFANRTIRLHRPDTQDASKTTTRYIPLLPGAIVLLEELGPKKSGKIITCTAGNYSQVWRHAADRAQIYDARLHDCRRECISRLIETCNLDLASVAVFSGHSDLVTLKKYYVRLSPKNLAFKVADLLGGAELMPSL